MTSYAERAEERQGGHNVITCKFLQFLERLVVIDALVQAWLKEVEKILGR